MSHLSSPRFYLLSFTFEKFHQICFGNLTKPQCCSFTWQPEVRTHRWLHIQQLSCLLDLNRGHVLGVDATNLFVNLRRYLRAEKKKQVTEDNSRETKLSCLPLNPLSLSLAQEWVINSSFHKVLTKSCAFLKWLCLISPTSVI